MIGPGRIVSSAVAWLVVLATGVASAQVDYRVNRGDALGTGRALDQNPGLGASGVNQPGSMFDVGERAGAVVTGNVTGLARFHGLSPVLSNNRFRTSLPSAGLSGFHARSVGSQGLRPNRVPAPTYYFGTQETIADLGYIRHGLNAPGSSVLVSPSTPPARPTRPRSSLDGLQIPDPTDLRVGDSKVATELGIFQQEVTPGAMQDPLAAVASPFGLAAESSIFGTPASSLPVSIAELRASQQRDSALEPLFRSRYRPAVGAEELARDRKGLLEVGGSADSQSKEPGLGPGSGAAQVEEPTLGIQQVRVGGPVEGEVPETPGQRPADLGDDRFADLYRAVEVAEALGLRRSGFQLARPTEEQEAPAAVGARVSEQALKASMGPRAVLRRSDKAVAELATAARWSKDLLDDPITTFVGKHQSRFNDRMAGAEAALQAGEYYNAARHYELAHVIDPRDPLPLLGRGHALAAAGDYVTAAWLLQKGIGQFPQIAAFRLDLVALVGQQDVFDIRRADLERKLARSEDFELRFLLGYLELYSGLPEEGLRNLDRSASLAPAGSVISIFPDLVLGRRPLPALRKQ